MEGINWKRKWKLNRKKNKEVGNKYLGMKRMKGCTIRDKGSRKGNSVSDIKLLECALARCTPHKTVHPGTSPCTLLICSNKLNG